MQNKTTLILFPLLLWSCLYWVIHFPHVCPICFASGANTASILRLFIKSSASCLLHACIPFLVTVFVPLLWCSLQDWSTASGESLPRSLTPFINPWVLSVCVCTYLCVYIHICVYIYIIYNITTHTYTQSYIYVYIHTQIHNAYHTHRATYTYIKERKISREFVHPSYTQYTTGSAGIIIIIIKTRTTTTVSRYY